MTHYDYKVVPAPRKVKKVRGIKAPEELFAATLTDAINEVARQGWEYVRAEHMPAEASRGWFRSAERGEQTVLVFRRPREALGPRLASVRSETEAVVEEFARAPEPVPDELHAPRPIPPAERAVVDRMRRREPSIRLDHLGDGEPAEPTPLRPPLRGPDQA